jgi:tagatose-1,6-bisphosphate aldolase
VLNPIDQTISLGRRRGIARIADQHGIFRIIALDHCATLKSMLKRCISSENPSWQDIVAEKVRLTKALLPHSSAVLLDPNYGLGPLIERDVIPPSVGIRVAGEREQFLNRVAVGRLKILNAIASSLATPLQQRLPKEAVSDPGRRLARKVLNPESLGWRSDLENLPSKIGGT